MGKITQQAHDVYTTSPQRCIDVETTLYKRRVSAGLYDSVQFHPL